MFKRAIASPATYAALFAAFIFLLSSVPNPPILGPMEMNDKIKHVALYSAFAALVSRAVAARERRLFLIAVWTVALVAVYGATDEYHQRFTPGRSGDAFDWMADVAGAVLVSLTLPLWFRGGQD
ncbi:MAG TPA: VanZ family protein [Armatimonadota bacterium]|jgi:VanZ family protein